MLDTAGDERLIADCGLQIIDRFALPESAWWAYYGPPEDRLRRLYETYSDDLRKLETAELIQREIEMYGYTFYLMRRPRG